ncbi:aldo/keto reductase, partial [Lysinibacillus fusiformis]|uniref:aldo/keto reductase n=1 Tax=Lysinibacillus fusiformis TaxID=28031 RepID=UPI0020BF6C32
SNGVEMRSFGLGVYKITEREETLQAIDKALKFGYRAIDTASLYGNEVEVREAMRHSGIQREDKFVTTKV